MKKVNPAFIDYLIAPLSGGADIDEEMEKYVNIDSNDEIAIKMIISSILKPEFDLKPAVFKEAAKKSLSYYLTTNKINFGRIIDSNLLPFDPPDDQRVFFKWIWEIFFEGEDYIMNNIEDYWEGKDIYEPLRLSVNNPRLKLP